ncbi:MAG: Bug family tripartite tricarboxylate transporter substrate binding protein [Rhodospirillaceae bacterium]
MKLRALTLAAVTLLSAPALAQPDFPNRPIRLIVTVPPGAGSDLLGRTLAMRLTERLGKQVIVDNRAGASGIIGMEMGAKAAPDGYTLVQGTLSTLAINPILIKPLPYDPLRDYVPISLIDDSSFILVTHPSLPVKDVKGLIALAKARPGGILYGSTGPGSMPHLVTHMLRSAAHIDVTHVPYKGAAPAFVDLLAGHITMMFSGLISAMPHVKSGKVVALGVAAAKRTEPVMNIPTIKEAGGPDIRASFWNGIMAPAKTPPAIVEKLNREIVAVINSPEYIAAIRAGSGNPVSSTPEGLGKLIKFEIDRYTRVVQESGAKAE